MSDVLIKNMMMPKSCPCELVGVGYDLHCTFVYGVPSRTREYYECCEKETRPDWCPLIEVPPHGRLIDADALIREAVVKFYVTDYFSHICEMIDNAPTVIEAEESET